MVKVHVISSTDKQKYINASGISCVVVETYRGLKKKKKIDLSPIRDEIRSVASKIQEPIRYDYDINEIRSSLNTIRETINKEVLQFDDSYLNARIDELYAKISEIKHVEAREIDVMGEVSPEIEKVRNELSMSYEDLYGKISEFQEAIEKSVKQQQAVLVPTGKLRHLGDVSYSKRKPQVDDVLMWTGKRWEPGIIDLTELIDDATTVTDKTWSSDKINTEIGNIIDDASTASDSTWSSTKISTELSGKSDTGHTHSTSDITSGTFADSRIAESNITQHEGALSVTESQISDLGGTVTMNADTDVSGNSWVVDEDTMTSNSATKVPTQQSTKAYVDSKVGDGVNFVRVDAVADDNSDRIFHTTLAYNSSTDRRETSGVNGIGSGVDDLRGCIMDLGTLQFGYLYLMDGNALDFRFVINTAAQPEANGIWRLQTSAEGDAKWIYGFWGHLVRAEEMDAIEDFTDGTYIYIVDNGPDYTYYDTSRGDEYGAMYKVKFANLTDDPGAGSQEINFVSAAPGANHNNFNYVYTGPFVAVRTVTTATVTRDAGDPSPFYTIADLLGSSFDNGENVSGHVIYIESETNSKEGFYYMVDGQGSLPDRLYPIQAPTGDVDYGLFIIYDGTSKHFGRMFMWNFTYGASNIVELNPQRDGITRVTTTATLDYFYYQWNCDMSGGAYTITLPAGIQDMRFRIVNMGSINTLTIASNGSEKIRGSTSNYMLMAGSILEIGYDATDGRF